MRLATAILLLLGAVAAAVGAAESGDNSHGIAPKAVYDDDSQTGTIPKLMRPQKGLHKEEHEVDPGNQRQRADQGIAENGEEEPWLINSMDELR